MSTTPAPPGFGPGPGPGAGTGAGTALLEEIDQQMSAETPWQVLLHNDPVNLTKYVTRTLIKVLKCTEETAERYMMLAHTLGKAAVFAGSREECESIAAQLGNHSLWATLEKADS